MVMVPSNQKYELVPFPSSSSYVSLLVLNNVLFIPYLKNNLLSPSFINDNDFEVKLKN